MEDIIDAIMGRCGKHKNAPFKDVYVISHKTFEYVSFCGQRDFDGFK